MKVLVTGATGFIGRHLTERLVKDGFDVVATGRRLSKLAHLSHKVRLIRLNIEESESVKNLIRTQKPEVVFHCAANIKSSNYDKLRRANAHGTENVLSASLQAKVKKVIYLSSVAVLSGNSQRPLTDDMAYSATNKYGRSKIEAEKIALTYREKGLNIAILRPPFVCGEGEPHFLPILIKLIKWRLLPVFGEGNNSLHIMNVHNLIDIMVLSLYNENALIGTYIVADKETLSIREVLHIISDTIGVKPPFNIPQSFTACLARIPFFGKYTRYFLKERSYSTKRLENKLGYVGNVLSADGLRRSVSDYLNRK
ncbi:NAD-dependent epimerase/dehydratase family protein [Candidatus Omnitrophota bacterium]